MSSGRWDTGGGVSEGSSEDAGGADLTVSGDTVTMTVGENVAFGNFLYMKVDGKLWLADANAAATMPIIAMATATILADAAGIVLLKGFARDDTWTWTVGTEIFGSATAGEGVQTAPAVAGDQVQIIGMAVHADRMLFNPDQTFIEV